VIAGAVKGDIDVHGPVILDASSVVMGNIKSKSVQINNGAIIEGMCSQCYAEMNPTSFFDDLLNKNAASGKKNNVK
jgi:cytoskeletal protein CcmA (bactofilin family)